jgi:hypothetical protein
VRVNAALDALDRAAIARLGVSPKRVPLISASSTSEMACVVEVRGGKPPEPREEPGTQTEPAPTEGDTP